MRGSRLAAGYDLSSAYDLIVPARGKALVKTDLEMAIPEGCYGRVGKRAPPHTVCALGGSAVQIAIGDALTNTVIGVGV